MKREHRGPLFKIGWLLAATLVIVGCALNVWINLPVETTETVVQLKGNLEGYPASPLKDRQVKITLPAALVLGSPEPIQVSLLPGGDANPQPAVVSITANLDLPHADLFPAESIQTPYFSDKPVSYRWLATAQDAGLKEGRIWLYGNLNSSFGGENQVPVLALPVEFAVRGYLGLSGPTARWIGFGLIGLGLVCAGGAVLWRKTKSG